MTSLCVEIIRLADNSFPGWVECKFVDADGLTHMFVEKIPIVTAEPLGPASTYPKIGAIDCEVVAKLQKDRYEIDTGRPWRIASTTGATRFVAHISQFLEF